MKKILALCISLALIISIVPAATIIAYGTDSCVVEFYQAQLNKPIQAFNNNQSIYAKVSFTAPTDGKAVILTALYDKDGVLETAVIDNADNLTANEPASVQTRNITTLSTTQTVRVFVWEGTDNLIPAATNYGEIKKRTSSGGGGVSGGGSGGSSSGSDVSDGKTTSESTLSSGNVSAVVPAGTMVTADNLTLTVTELETSASGISAGEDEVLLPLDIHIEGVAANNTVPVIVTVKEVLSPGLNKGNLTLYHVENGQPVKMEEVDSLSDLTKHNQFHYDPATGTITLAMATFSEVVAVSNTVNAWNGTVDYSWYTEVIADNADATNFTIANADQLAAFGKIVGGMDGQTQDSFAGKTVKLIADVNLGDDEKNNVADKIFHPIGYSYIDGDSTVSSFEGTFDGNGHTISNFYQNTWEIEGDYSGTYYKDAMGLFGYVVNGKVENLTVDNFSSDGEYTPTGVIAAYAVNSTFENIAITNCNPRVYNTGNGGIVGIGGNSDDPDTYKLTFTNITIDNSNKISALWGSYDVACGGLVGMFRGAGHVYMTNCHVAAQLDVYNDVCGNYQYYWYRYAGMMVGTNKNMITDVNGYTVPETSKFHAKGCTVHFGDWNDYYYCELVANTLASYTHDHQFSRLDKVDSVNVGSMTVTTGEKTTSIPTSGRYNYVVVNGAAATENATCYHFVDGKVWNHTDAGYETTDVDGDGVVDSNLLKEDRQHYYLPFNQLFTGYGWGVKHVPVYNGEDYAFEGITILDREVADSVEKFAKADTAQEIYVTGETVTIGELFKTVNSSVAIDEDNVQVTVSPVGEDSTVSGTYTANTTDWTKGTLTFSGVGKATVTIQDYNYCIPTTINVTIEEPAKTFVSKFTNDYLYRIGNKNPVALGSLFDEVSENCVRDAKVSVSIEVIAGTVTHTYTANTTEWENGTIDINNTGVVNVTIQDGLNESLSLKLEIVDAKNATTATSATSNNVVLLNDCGFSSLEVSGGYTLYGNGFTMTCGSDSAVLDMGYSFVTLNNGTLDNVQIVCPNFDYAALYKSNLTSNENRSETTDKTRYYNAKSGVMASGSSQILNSRISGGRAALNVSGGNVVVDNSRIELGAVASVLVGAANSLTLRDVTLVQKPTASTYDSSKTLMGFSVLFVCDANGDAAPVTLEGSLVQNAWVDENDKQYVPSAGQSIITTVLEKTEYLHDLDGEGTNESLNLGFAYMPESLTSKVNTTTITDNRTNKDTIPYDYAEVSILNGKTYVYSYKNTNGTADSFKTESEYVPNKYSDIITVSYSDTADGLTTGKSYGTDGWVYELNVDLDKLSGYSLDFSKLSMSVNGASVTDYKVNGNVKPTSPVAVTAGGTTYTLTATIEGKEYTATYKVTGTETSKESPALVGTPSYGAGFGVANKYGGDWSAAAPVLDGITVKYWSVADSEYKEFALSSITFANTGKQNGTNNYWEYTHTNNDFTLKLTNTAVIHSSSGTYGMPVAGKDGKLYFTISSSGGFVSTGTTSRSITIAYEFTDNNGGDTLKFSHTWSIPYSKDEQYNYSTFTSDGTLTKLESSGGNTTCLAEGTLITLADGSKRKVEDLRKGDLVMSFDHQSGKGTAKDVIIVVKTASDHYKNTFVFDDGTKLVTINEHGIFDLNLNKYVNIDNKNASEFIGHSFVSIDATGNIATKKLVKVESKHETGYKYDIVTDGTLNYVAEDTLSVTHVLVDVINTFEFDKDLIYNASKMKEDIEKYGLYTFDEWMDYCEISVFEQYNIPVMKVGISKGLYTKDYIIGLINKYVLDESVQIID